MSKNLSEYMQWTEIDAIMRSEHDRPKQILGARMVEDGVLIQAYFPGAEACKVMTRKDRTFEMQEMKDGFFAVLIPALKIPSYQYLVTYGEENTVTCRDPYVYPQMIKDEDIKKFQAGIHYEIYKVLGAHPTKIKGVAGVRFAVWAPNALRVSVVGDFNQWDGRRHPMQRIDHGIHELFIPGLKVGTVYKYEIKHRNTNGGIVLKSDPYGTSMQLRPDNASVVCGIDGFDWTDKEWLKTRKKTAKKEKPEFIYEMHLGGFMRPEEVVEMDEAGNEVITSGASFYTYRELAPKVADYVTNMGYTHIELLPIMEHPLDQSWGYQVTGYYAPTSRYGTPEDLMYFINYMHEHNIGVILDWVPAHFPKDLNGLAWFDGGPLYEYADPRRGEHPDWGTLIFDYGKNEVKNFLIANALYWIEQYHVDGLRIDAVASMLYLDYGRKNGEWVANIYGGKEHLEAIEFLKHLNSVIKKRNSDVQIIAEESTAWPRITGDLNDDGLGFDYKWNMGWMNDYLNYIKIDPYFKSGAYGELLFSMIYAYSEKFILVFSHDEVVHGKGSMIQKMPGIYEDKFANLRLTYGYMTTHPGKKLLFMGQDFAQFSEFNEAKELEWFMLKYDLHKKMQDYMKELLHLYREYPALYELDEEEEGFTWINNISANESIIVFTRNTNKKEQTLLVICNFTPVVHEQYMIGVPYRGKYKEIFNSDAERFGGQGNINPRLKQSKTQECDGLEESIKITVPPCGISIFKCTPIEAKKAVKNSKTASKKPASKSRVEQG